VLVVDESVEVLEELRTRTRAPNVFYFLGWPEVLPLPDGSVDEVVGPPASGDAQRELARVLRT
jgi:hypothetical protein